MYLNYKQMQNRTELDFGFGNSNIISWLASKFFEFVKDFHPEPIFADFLQ